MPEVTIETDGEKVNPEDLVAQIVEAVEDAPRDSAPIGVEIVGAMVPIFLFIAVAATYCAKYYFAHRARQDIQQTVRAALERGDPMTSQLLDRLVEPPPPKRNDLRRGMIGITLGIGIAAFGFIIGEEDAIRPLLAVGTIPLLLGIAYLILSRLDRNPGRD